MQIGIISDTHGILPNAVINNFKNVDYIFHAGDIGEFKIIEMLKKIAPVIAVYGNIDSGIIKRELPAFYYNSVARFVVYMTHDIGSVKNFRYELFKTDRKPDMVIHGHTHKPSIETFQNIVFINPGSVSYPRSQEKGTIAILDLNYGKIFSHRFIEI